MSMIRKLMRSAARAKAKNAAMKSHPAMGMVRTGMHHKTEQAYRHALMTENEHSEETVEEALDLPEALEELIPPEELTEPAAEETADRDVVIVPDEELLEELSDPLPEDTDEPENDPDTVEQLSVDYSGAALVIPEPVTGGVDCEPRDLVYDPEKTE